MITIIIFSRDNRCDNDVVYGIINQIKLSKQRQSRKKEKEECHYE